MTPEDLNKLASERQAANMRADLGALHGDLIDARTQLETAGAYIGTLEEEAKLSAAKLEAAETQVEQSGAEIERLTTANAALKEDHATLLAEYSAYHQKMKGEERVRRTAARGKRNT